MNWPWASGCASDSWYWVTTPSSALAKPTLVLSGFDPSELKLSDPLKVEERCAGRVVCSTNSPVLMLWAPLIFVTLPEKFHSVLKPKNGQRLSTLNEAMFPPGPPLKEACGIRLSGFADGKNWRSAGSTTVRSLARRAASSKALVYWGAQLTATVTSANSVGLRGAR